MKIRKNGKVINLTESDLQRIVKRTLNEDEGKKEAPSRRAEGTLSTRNGDFLDYLESLGGVKRTGDYVEFMGPDGNVWAVTLDYVWNKVGVDDDPRWVDRMGRGQMTDEFRAFFSDRKDM